MIVIIAGLPGTGKSTLAQALAQRLPCAVLDKDSIRASLFQPAYVEYSQAQDDFCQEIMLQTAAYLLSKHADLHVLLDGRTFSRRYQRDRVIEFCSQLGTTWATMECVCSEATALGRIAEAVAAKQSPRRKSHSGPLSRNSKGMGTDRPTQTRYRHRRKHRVMCRSSSALSDRADYQHLASHSRHVSA